MAVAKDVASDFFFFYLAFKYQIFDSDMENKFLPGIAQMHSVKSTISLHKPNIPT